MARVKIPVYSKEGLDFFIGNISKNLDHYLNKDTDNWAISFMSDNNYEPVRYLELENVKLTYTTKSERAYNDARNAIELHKALSPSLNRAMASSGAIWTMYSLHQLEYLNNKSGVEQYLDSKKTEGEEQVKTRSKVIDIIKKKYCVSWSPSMKELGDCILPNLYRIADLTYDQNREDHYELTTIAFQNSDILLRLSQTLAFFADNVVQGVLEYVKKANDKGYTISSVEGQKICSHLNTVAGSCRIDMMTADDIVAIIEKYMDWYQKQTKTNQE